METRDKNLKKSSASHAKKPNTLVGIGSRNGRLTLRDFKLFYGLIYLYQKSAGVGRLPVALPPTTDPSLVRVLDSHFWFSVGELKEVIGYNSNNNENIRQSFKALSDNLVTASAFTPEASFLKISGESHLLASFLYAQFSDDGVVVREDDRSIQIGSTNDNGLHIEPDLFGSAPDVSFDSKKPGKTLPAYIGVEFSTLVREGIVKAMRTDYVSLELQIISKLTSIMEMGVYTLAKRYATWKGYTPAVSYPDFYQYLTQDTSGSLPEKYSTWKAKRVSKCLERVAALMSEFDAEHEYSIELIEGPKQKIRFNNVEYANVPSSIALKINLVKERPSIGEMLKQPEQVSLDLSQGAPNDSVSDRLVAFRPVGRFSTADFISLASNAYSCLNGLPPTSPPLNELDTLLHDHGLESVVGSLLKAKGRGIGAAQVKSAYKWLSSVNKKDAASCLEFGSAHLSRFNRNDRVAKPSPSETAPVDQGAEDLKALFDSILAMRDSEPRFLPLFLNFESRFLETLPKTLRRRAAERSSVFASRQFAISIAEFFVQHHESIGLPYPKDAPQNLV